MGKIDPSKTPTEVGTAIRDGASAFVKKGFDEGTWRVWADCHKLIEWHEGSEEQLPEGMDAFCSVGYDEGLYYEDCEEDDEPDGKEAGGSPPHPKQV